MKNTLQKRKNNQKNFNMTYDHHLINQQPFKRKNQLLKTAGIRAWYDVNGQPVEPFIIGIGGKVYLL